MKILVCGSRTWRNTSVIAETLQIHFDKVASKDEWEDFTIIEGNAMGADRIAGELAEKYGWTHQVFPANWAKYGLMAGPLRNKQMLVEGKPDLVIAFWDGRSRGTQDMINQSKRAGFPVEVVMG